MASQVDPITARKGTFIDSFAYSQKAEMLRTVDSLQKVMRQLARRTETPEREIVYTFIKPWGHAERLGTWQIFLLN